MNNAPDMMACEVISEIMSVFHYIYIYIYILFVYDFFIPFHNRVSILVFFIKKIWRSPVTFFVFLEISKMRNRMEINL